jgi:hypothetical protein
MSRNLNFFACDYLVMISNVLDIYKFNNISLTIIKTRSLFTRYNHMECLNQSHEGNHRLSPVCFCGFFCFMGSEVFGLGAI